METFLEENEIPNLMIYSQEKSFVPDYIRPKKIVEDEYIDLSFLKLLKPEEINEGVRKTMIKQGEFLSKFEELPKIGAICHFKYESRKLDGKLTDIGRDRNEVRKVKLYKQDILPGIHIAISTMKPKEISWFEFTPKYHYYSDENSETRVNADGEVMVGKDESLLYKIELVSYRNIENLDSSNFAGRIKKLEELKFKGNEQFKQAQFHKAGKIYNEGLSILRSFPKKLLEILDEQQKKELLNYHNALYGNASLTKIKLKSYFEALKLSEEGMKNNNSTGKLIFRQGQSYLYLHEYEKAKTCFQKIISLDENNIEAQEFIKKCNDFQQKTEQLEKNKYRKLLKLMSIEEENTDEYTQKILKKKKLNDNSALTINKESNDNKSIELDLTEEALEIIKEKNDCFENLEKLAQGVVVDIFENENLFEEGDNDINEDEREEELE